MPCLNSCLILLTPKILALRMYYLELSDGVSSIEAQDKVSRMCLVSTRSVRRWVQLWEATGEESLFDGRCECGDREKSILFYCPALVFELRQWINALKTKEGSILMDI